MTKLRKQRRRKTYRYNINRKRLRNKIKSKGKVTCKQLKEAWDFGKSAQSNLISMGLSYDPNATIKISNNNATSQGWTEEMCNEKPIPSKAFVAEALEKDARAPRERLFRLPNSQVEWITYLMDKYGTDYKSMAKDKKNHYQETWKQLRAKIKLFKGVPEQYSKYLEKHGLDVQDAEESGISSDDEL